MNGLGSKVTSIFSKEFCVQTVDSTAQQLYQQTFHCNMTDKTAPKITPYKKYPFTSIRFLPDYEKFGALGMTDDMYTLLMKRAYDVCAVTEPNIAVTINGEKATCKTFEKYVDLYIGAKGESTRFYEAANDNWQVVAAHSTSGFQHVSFVNGICTFKGGRHLDAVSNAIVKALVETVEKKKKVALKPQHIKDNLALFIKATIVNPTFDSQSKECLTTPASKFGSKFEVSDKFIEKLYKSDIVASALVAASAGEAKAQKKTDGSKKTRLRGMAKLNDAALAGTARSKECTLILTEGDSAASMAISGLAVTGRDRYGVFPLRGKLLNVKDAPASKIFDNVEITALKKIIGLESGKEYTTIDDLRYGKVMLMTDADNDGTHIRGLLINMVHSLWPSLLKFPNFISAMQTPIVKVKKGTTVVEFYNDQDYTAWKEANDQAGWATKYYKGLGTSTADEAKAYFSDIQQVNYVHTGPASDMAISLAFDKKKADDRKEWLHKYDYGNIIHKQTEVSYEDFVNKDLIHFSNADVLRSIPSIVDGLKTSQRKIMFGVFKKNLKNEIKVEQLAGFVGEHSGYHHGATSLEGAIVGLAQDFVGSNNMNLLKPVGMFGSRIQGGSDAASARYIFTELQPWTLKTFRKEDNLILKYLEDDGYPVEPEWYAPVIPMVLLNGAIGIGTGFSTSIPSYNPIAVMEYLVEMIKHAGAKPDMDMRPWYRGFKGEVEATDSTVVSKGCFTVVNEKTVDITELPVGTWTQNYKQFLEEYMDANPAKLKDYDSHYNDQAVRFTLHFNADELAKLLPNFAKEFKLVSKNISTKNMHLFNAMGQITKYDTVHDIMREFYAIRFDVYERRKAFLIQEKEHDVDILKIKIKFINDVMIGAIEIVNQGKEEIKARLDELDYPTDAFEFLLRMQLYTLTKEKVEELVAELAKELEALESLRGMIVGDIWQAEIAELCALYVKDLAAYDVSQENAIMASKGVAVPPGKRRKNA